MIIGPWEDQDLKINLEQMAFKLDEQMAFKLDDIVKRNAFTIRPTHWYLWLWPPFWRTKRICEKVLAHQWQNGMEKKYREMIRDVMLYGEGYIEL